VAVVHLKVVDPAPLVFERVADAAACIDEVNAVEVGLEPAHVEMDRDWPGRALMGELMSGGSSVAVDWAMHFPNTSG
jgi:hypothetical protein